MSGITRIDSGDNVAVAFEQIDKGTTVSVPGRDRVTVLDDIPAGHKIALEEIAEGAAVIKYGAPIGRTVKTIRRGERVHTHNLKTALTDQTVYAYEPALTGPEAFKWKNPPEIRVYRRANRRAGIRNELWVIPTVGCVNGIADHIIREFKATCDHSAVDGIYSFPHPYGCSQLGGDHERTKKMLQNIALHPNAGGILVVGLGCENNQIDSFKASMPEQLPPERIMFLTAQDAEDEIAAGVELLKKLYAEASLDQRVPGSWREIVVGLECGGSDAFSGITANPLIGRASDYIVSQGGTAVLTEVPEMFGAEQILMQQCADAGVFDKTVEMINDFKTYYTAHDQPIYENPSPGNKAGGITTLEDKSLGCTRKAGKSSIVDVVKIDERVTKTGLNLLYSPGNDIVATTALGAAGCQIVLFSTGRGTPLGGFIPTLKVATTTELARRKSHWIDFDAGSLTDPQSDQDGVLARFLDVIVAVINGQPVAAEANRYREFAIFKTGVTL